MTRTFPSRSSLRTALLVLAGTSCLAIAQTTQQIVLPSFQATSTSNTVTRGYYFTAPADMTILGLRAPDESNTGTQSVQVLQLQIQPMPYPGPALAGTSLFHAAQAPAGVVLPCSIHVTAGQVIGVFGGCGTSPLACSTSTATHFATDIGGHTVTLTSGYRNGNVSGSTNGTVQAGGAFGRVHLYCTVDPVPTQATIPPFQTSLTRNGMHGMSFLAPTNFVIRGLRVPDENHDGVQTIEVSRSSAPLTNTPAALQQLFRSVGTPSYQIVPCNILCRAGDWITILGGCGSSWLTASLGSSNQQTISVAGLTVPAINATTNSVQGNQPTYTNSNGVGRIEVYYDVGGQASYQSFGSGCGFASRAFEETMTAPAFDLDYRSLRIQPANGGYAVTPAGTYLPPSPLAQSLPLGDDDTIAVGMPTPFPHEGTNIGTMTVHSNGFVTGSGAVWGTQHDFDPSAAGSGHVVHEMVGNRWHVTWLQVFTYATTTASTMQIQFDLTTGEVFYVWRNMDQAADDYSVEFRPRNLSVFPVPMDLSMALANGGFLLPATEHRSPYMDMPNPPVMGMTVQMHVHDISPGAVIGFTQLGLQSQNLDLTAYGMPGCHQYLVPLTTTLFPTSLPVNVPFTVPLVQAALGMHVFAQSALYDPGSNARNVITSDGLEMILDLQ